MNIEKKKTSEKKIPDNNIPQVVNTNSALKDKNKIAKKSTMSKITSDKEIKLDEDPVFIEDTNKLTTSSNFSTKSSAVNNIKLKKGNTDGFPSLSGLSSTPKSSKVSTQERTFSKVSINSFSTNLKNNQVKTTDKRGTGSSLILIKNPGLGIGVSVGVSNNLVNTKSPQKPKKIGLSTNPQVSAILTNLELYMINGIKERILFSFTKINSLQNVDFFIRLLRIKKEMSELLTTHENNLPEYQPYLLRYIEGTVNHLKGLANITTNYSSNNEINYEDNNLKSGLNDISTMSDDGLINYIYYKNNSVSFEIPLKRSRALSEQNKSNTLKTKFINKLSKNNTRRTRLSSEEIEKRMKEKLSNAEKNKNNLKLQYEENLNKIMSKISSIKQKKKKEKQENMQRLVDKLEKYNFRHQQFLDEKTSKAKSVQEKVAEVNFLNRMEKENRDLSIIKKLNISIERRENYMMQKLNKTIQRNIKEEAVEIKRKNVEDEFKLKAKKKFEKNIIKKEDEYKISVDSKIDIVNKRKSLMEDRFEFLKNVYSENFIWELLQADYFDVDVLNNLTSITKFEILKAKLKKDRELIDNMFDKNNKSKTKTNNGSETIYSCSIENDINNNYGGDADLSNDNIDVPKRSKSFTMFNENDLLEVDYLFKDTLEKKKKKKKKKKKPEVIKDKIIRSINSMTQSDLNIFYTKIYKDKNIKKFLIRSKNGKYIKSKIIVRNEEPIILPIKLEPDLLLNNNNNNNSLSDTEQGSDKEHLHEENKEKLMRNIVQNNSDVISKIEICSSSSNTILINSESLTNILEKNSILVKWCKLCNMILPNDDSSLHLSKFEHKKLKTEYGISLQDDSTFIMVFQTLPGDCSEDLKNERINAIKLRFKKVKQKLSLRAVKHENFWSYKQDFPSNNKQRLQKISFDIEKQILPIIKDYESLENNLKELIKILEQKKQNDLHIMRGLKVIHCLVEVLRKPAVCHKSEIKNLGKVIELVVKVLMYFSTIIENRNYMVVTNRLSAIVDLLLWVLNKPSKIPLGISFLPDLIYLITIHIKHRIPFEHLTMKDDFIEYLFLSNILAKFRQKYTSLVGPIDLTSGFGSFPLVLLKSLGMIDALTSQININYMSKPVYVKNTKISENILFVLEYTELVGIVQLVTTMLLSNGPVKPKSEKENSKNVVLPQTVVSATILGSKVLNNIARLDLSMFQNVCNCSLIQEQMYHMLNYIINYSLEYVESSDDLKELLHETILMLNYLCLLNDKFQSVLSRGEVTLIQRLCSLPFSYFCEKKLKDILFPTLIAISYKNERNVEILNKEINLEMLIMFLKEKIQLEPIIEEEEMDKLDESREEINFNLIKMSKDQFVNSISNEAVINGLNGLKKRTMSFSSTASSTKSCHDMLTGVSDYIPLHHRFPRNLWEKALEFYINFGK